MKFWRKFIQGIAEFFTGKELKSSVEKNSEQMEELKSKMALLLERLPEEEGSEVALPERELSLVNPFNHEQELLKVECLGERHLTSQKGYKKLKGGKGGAIHSLIQQVPNLFSAHALSKSYKVIIPPKGADGELMKLANGLLSTVMKGKDGKILAHAGLKSMASAASPLLIFSALSTVTGQYFMAEINSNLEQIKRDIKDIRDILFDDKMAQTEAYYNFLNHVTDNYRAITKNKMHSEATLRNIQEVGYKLFGDIKFYSKQLNRAVGGLSEEQKYMSDIQEDVENVTYLFTYWALAIKCYFWQQSLEISYSGNYDSDYLENTHASLYQQYKYYLKFRESTLDRLDTFLSNNKAVKRNVGQKFLGVCSGIKNSFIWTVYCDTSETRNEKKVREINNKAHSKIEDGREMLGIIESIADMKFRDSQPLEVIVNTEKEEVYVKQYIRK